jgi:hypothetical protein
MGRLVAAMHQRFPDFVIVFYIFNEHDKERKPLRE